MDERRPTRGDGAVAAPSKEPSGGDRRALLGVAVLALALRLLPLGWGAGLRPHEGFYHPDEPKVFASTAGFPGNYLSNPILIYGTAVQYGLGVVLLPAKVLWAWGLRPPPFAHYGHFVLLAERGLHVLLGVLTVLVLYRLGLRLFDRRVALLASTLLAISPLHVLNSALATLDVPAAFLATLVLLLSLRAFDSERRRDFVWLGVAAGALLGTKIAASVALVAPLTLLVATASLTSSKVIWSRFSLSGGTKPVRRMEPWDLIGMTRQKSLRLTLTCSPPPAISPSA